MKVQFSGSSWTFFFQNWLPVKRQKAVFLHFSKNCLPSFLLTAVTFYTDFYVKMPVLRFLNQHTQQTRDQTTRTTATIEKVRKWQKTDRKLTVSFKTTTWQICPNVSFLDKKKVTENWLSVFKITLTLQECSLALSFFLWWSFFFLCSFFWQKWQLEDWLCTFL